MLKGGVSGPVLVPGDSANSLIVKRILGDAGPRMPMGSDSLQPDEITSIRNWIDEGAKVRVDRVPAAEFSLSLHPPARGGINELMSRYYQAQL